MSESGAWHPFGTAHGQRAAPQVALLVVGLFFGLSTPAEARQQVRQPYSRSVEAPAGGVLQVSNEAGSIRVSAWNRPTIQIVAEKVVRLSDSEAASNLLDQIRIDVSVADTMVTVLTRYPSGAVQPPTARSEQPIAEVHYTIQVPSEYGVALRSVSAGISLHGVSGAARLESVNGDLTATGVGGWVVAGSFNGNITIEDATTGADVNTVSGDVQLTGLKGRIRATCISGNIAIRDALVDEMRASNTGGDITYEGSITPAAAYVLSSHSGDIRFTVTGERGYSAQLSTFSGSISAPFDFELTGTRTSRRSLTGTYRNPEASVTLTAYSGNISIHHR
jgi:hypothetical protein